MARAGAAKSTRLHFGDEEKEEPKKPREAAHEDTVLLKNKDKKNAETEVKAISKLLIVKETENAWKPYLQALIQP